MRRIDEPALFTGQDTTGVVPHPGPVRVFVTNDELRSCLSKHVLAPWIDRADPGTGSPRPVPLAAFDGPVAIETLDTLRPRGPNTYWVGLEVDASVLRPGSSLPALLPALVPFGRVRRIVFRNAEELDLFEVTRMANVALPTERATCDPTWFNGDAANGLIDLDKHLGESDAIKVVADAESFRRRFGAAIAVLDGAAAGGMLPASLIALVLRLARGKGLDLVDDDGVAALWQPTDPSGVDAAIGAWTEISGLRSSDAPADAQVAVDHLVRCAVTDHLAASSGAALDRQRLAATIESAAAEAGHDARWVEVANRYAKAVQNVRRLWRSEITWDNLLRVWPSGFPTLLAAMAFGSVSDADQYDVLHRRLVDLSVPADAAQLARSFYGLRWGIDAIPTQHRGSEATQRLAETMTWSTISSTKPEPVSLRLAREQGRLASRPYLLDLAIDQQTIRLELAPAAVVAAKLRRAIKAGPVELRSALAVLAAKQPSARPYLSWKIRLPRSSFHVDLERGRAALSGPMADGEPILDFEWSDWPAFEADALRPAGILEQLKNASDLAAWEKAIDAVEVAGAPTS